MKLLFLIFILLFSFTASSNLVYIPYCRSDEGRKTGLPDPKILSREDYSQLLNFLVKNNVPIVLNSCIADESPELIQVFKYYQSKNFDMTDRYFFESNYIKKFLSLDKNAFFREVDLSKFKTPTEFYNFYRYMIPQITSMNLLLSDVFPREKLHTYLEKQIKETDAFNKAREARIAEDIKKEEERKRQYELQAKQQEEERKLRLIKEQDEKDKKYADEVYEVKSRKHLMIFLIEKGEKAIVGHEEAIKNKLAVDKEDFVKKLILACYKMNCEIPLRKKLVEANNGKLNFRLYEELSPLTYMIKNNLYEEVKAFLETYPDFAVQNYELELAANLGSPNIFELLTKFKKNPKSNSNIVFDKIRTAKNISEDAYYSLYFLSKYKSFKPKHMLGYFSIESSSLYYANEIYKRLKIEIPYVQINDYVFEKPNWNSSKKLFSSIEVKKEEIRGDEYGVVFDEISDGWLGIRNKDKTYWIHSSQVLKIEFVDQFVNSTTLGDASSLFRSISGKKLSEKEISEYKTSIKVLGTKWLNGELWINVDLYNNSDQEEEQELDKKDGHNLWLKAFDGETRNFINYYMGC